MARNAGVVRHPATNHHRLVTKTRGSLDVWGAHASDFGQFWSENDSLCSEDHAHGIKTEKRNPKTERRAPMTIFNTRVCGIRRGILDDAATYPQVFPNV